MKKKYEIGLYNNVTNRVDYRPAQSAYVVSDETDYKYSNITKTRAPGGIVYKLKWRGRINGSISSKNAALKLIE